ncbi:MAG: HEAT repeat domain-containing protein [Bryobacteraceae bacterium]
MPLTEIYKELNMTSIWKISFLAGTAFVVTASAQDAISPEPFLAQGQDSAVRAQVEVRAQETAMAQAQDSAVGPRVEVRAQETAMAQAQDSAVRAQERVMRAERIRGRGNEDRLRSDYRRGKDLLDRRQYEGAIAEFDRVIDAKSSSADGALYWKAYALNKLGRRPDALAALTEIQKLHPDSGWRNDAHALATEVGQASGHGVSPESQSDEDLKLLAINSLINSDPDRTVPLIEKLLADPKNPPKLKERALFVLAQSRSAKAREILAQYAKGGANPDVQMKAVEYLGVLGTSESRQLLSEIYNSSHDLAVRRAALRSFMATGDRADLAAAARSEKDPDLRREAIEMLGANGGQTELAQLYTTESSPEVKDAILHGIFTGGNTAKLIEIAKTEKNPKLRTTAIHLLGISPRDKSADALVSLYSSETDKDVKAQIVNALFIQQSVKPLIDIARKETDPELKKRIVERLSMMRSKEANDYMMELLNK